MEILIIVVVMLIGLILLLAEVYLFSGASIAGIGAMCCLVFANIYTYINMGGTACLITFIATLISGAGILLWVLRSKSLDKVALNENIESTVHNEAIDNIHLGDTGITVTRLTLIGNATINGHIVEVKSLCGFIDEKTPIIVKAFDKDLIMVEPIENKN